MAETPKDSSVVELSPLTLVKWIDTSPDLRYIREAADNIQARYDSDSKDIAFQTPNRRTVSSREDSIGFRLKEFFWPSGKSLRGTTCASQEFDQSCRNTASLMAGSTLWDAVSTYPIIQYGFSSYLGILSIPSAISLSLLMMFFSNKAGQESCNRTKGKKSSARNALLVFFVLSAIKTALAGVGMDILVNSSGITKEYASQLANEQIDNSQRQLNELRKLRNPKYLEYKDSCDTLKQQMQGLKREDPLFTTLYVRAYGEYRQQLGNQSLSIKQILQKYGASISNVPGDCVKQRIQAEIDGSAADQLSLKLDKWRAEKESLPSLQFLQKYFPTMYSDKFKANGNDIVIRDGFEMVRAANTQFFSKLIDSSKIWGLGFSLFWMFISIILSVGAVFLLWGKSRSEDMKMSYSNELLLEREKFLEGYSATLDEFQSLRRNRLSKNKSFRLGNNS
jgi:hypothetical protein